MDELPASTSEIGFREDGEFWVTASREIRLAEDAERVAGVGWKAVEAVWVGPTGEMANSKDEEWEECSSKRPGARPGWRLVDTRMPDVFDGAERRPNEHFDPASTGPKRDTGGRRWLLDM